MEFAVVIAIRCLVLAAGALAVMYLLRVRTAAARHAVWTVVTAAMLLLPALSPLFPPFPLRVLRRTTVVQRAISLPEVRTREVASAAPAPVQAPAPHRFNWRQAAAAVYAAGFLLFLSRLAASYVFTRRLVRAGRPVELSMVAGVCESDWITVPVTVGFRNPKILLPKAWREWPAEKLAAVMTHEQVHVRRADWAIATIAGLNRCLFWFHPLAWWLERELASLAEQACDDAALLVLGARESYAQVLLDMAAAVKTSRGRMVWKAMAMAKTAEVQKRIDRILDETRPIPRGLTRSRWAALVACSLPLVYITAVMQLAPQLAPAQSAGLNPQLVSALERHLLVFPDDLAARGQLIANYYVTGVQHPRIEHIFWLIEHHPESTLAAFNSAAIAPGDDYAKAASLWRQQTAIHATDATVLGNAAQFFARPGGDSYEAERLLQQASALDPQSNAWTDRLAKLYASAILADAGYPDANAATANPAFAAHAKAVLQSSTGELRRAGGDELNPLSIRPDTPRPNVLARYPQLAPLAVLSRELTGNSPILTNAYEEVLPGRRSVDMDGSLVQKVNPVYPEQALQAGVEGDVQLKVNIGTDGRVQSTEPIEGNPLLAPAAQDAVMQYVYQPYTIEGQPREVQTTVKVAFRLDAAPLAPAMGLPSMGIGSGPFLLTRQPAEYTEEARQAKREGAVTLALTVGADGKAHDIRVVKPLGFGLDEKAIAAAKQWSFRPATEDGKPADYPTTVTVPFHFLPMAPVTIEIARKTANGPQDKKEVVLTPNPTAISTAKSFFIVSPTPGVMVPVLVSKVEPEYSDEARNARYQGIVMLSVTIGLDGTMQDIRVKRAIGLGLDEKAIEAVKQWKCQPAQQNGQVIPYAATVQIEFRLI